MGANRNNGEPRKGYETVEKQKMDPWGPTKPALEGIIGDLGSQYEQGVGTALPGFSPVADLGPTTQFSQNQLMDWSQNGAPGQQQFSDLYNMSMQPSSAETNLGGIAAGPGGQPNPYLSQLLDMGSENITNRVNSLQSAKGRYAGLGAGGHVDALSKGISDFQTPILYQTYNDDMNRQLAATGQIDASKLNRMGMGMGAAGAGAEAQFGLNSMLQGAGQYQDQNLQNQQMADYERWLWENGGADQASLANYLNGIGSIASLGGEGTVQEPYTPFKNAFGTALQIAGTVGKVAKLSDRRAKTDITLIGETPGGLGVYRFYYRSGGPEQVGVMADEVAEIQPWALGDPVDGYMTVDYGKIF